MQQYQIKLRPQWDIVVVSTSRGNIHPEIRLATCVLRDRFSVRISATSARRAAKYVLRTSSTFLTNSLNHEKEKNKKGREEKKYKKKIETKICLCFSKKTYSRLHTCQFDPQSSCYLSPRAPDAIPCSRSRRLPRDKS